MVEVSAERFWKGASRDSKGRYVGIQGGVGCLGAVEKRVVDWTKVGVIGTRRRVERDGVCGFDDEAGVRLIGGVVGAATAMYMTKR